MVFKTKNPNGAYSPIVKTHSHCTASDGECDNERTKHNGETILAFYTHQPVSSFDMHSMSL